MNPNTTPRPRPTTVDCLDAIRSTTKMFRHLRPSPLVARAIVHDLIDLADELGLDDTAADLSRATDDFRENPDSDVVDLAMDLDRIAVELGTTMDTNHERGIAMDEGYAKAIDDLLAPSWATNHDGPVRERRPDHIYLRGGDRPADLALWDVEAEVYELGFWEQGQIGVALDRLATTVETTDTAAALLALSRIFGVPETTVTVTVHYPES